MSLWQPAKRPPFEFPDFPRKPDEDGDAYVDRYTRERGAIQPSADVAPIEPPKGAAAHAVRGPGAGE
jgi:hypothetical protein